MPIASLRFWFLQKNRIRQKARGQIKWQNVFEQVLPAANSIECELITPSHLIRPISAYWKNSIFAKLFLLTNLVLEFHSFILFIGSYCGRIIRVINKNPGPLFNIWWRLTRFYISTNRPAEPLGRVDWFLGRSQKKFLDSTRLYVTKGR